MLRISILARAAKRPLLIAGLLAMIVGYHFLGLIGFWVALIAFVLLNVLLGRLERERAEMEGLRQMMERDELR
jgi:predicted PurR-regulated permease PerM